ncbi:replication-associated recombination protein A [Gilvimarinus agarilyticus]|uniref:replication-associated recombination protein A n=1 Tax=unclassified Gilvimarinus TaxID=2642066 RepID=UPI001C08D5C7|nr:MULTISPECIES: replication-associated recombination protein A [unclassified Gilvimarinus]MBU2886430.1 replication-associated recombination protein A [Gilvimarinus agarilyticus]MDO6571109.1 replication-associated recombination protein A [Gilvimarinus sp. 2_MG-2023]MDO6745653.1 replication-associated recombination protein A [Gilvimarinus sp. 1_MG-2023]
MNDLFAQEGPAQPLAARMRPRTLDEYIGQEHILGRGKPLREAVDKGQLHSMILWGPPGVGKTSLAKLFAERADARFETISAVLAGVKDIRRAVELAQQERQMRGRQTILFVDEVHRFNKSQQDAFLPYVEDGTFIFIGATTENPSFELNNALLSRCRVYVLRSLPQESLLRVIEQAIADERGFAADIEVDTETRERLAAAADGDARRALNLLQVAADLARDENGRNIVDGQVLAEVVGGDVRRFDKGGDLFYEQISAMHKAVRGSSPDGALYWMARMLDGGCDPLYIARRVVRMASEDIGNADPRGLSLALAAWDTQERLGSPEGELAIAQAISYLACAPKSNAVYNAFNQVMADVRSDPAYDVPMHLRNAPTALMKDMAYGQEYRYAHTEPGAYAAGEVYLPEEIASRRYYQPTDRGLEGKISDKLEYLRQLDDSSPIRRYLHED